MQYRLTHSFSVDEYSVVLLLLFQFALALTDANVLLLPVLGALGVSTGLKDDSLEGINSLTHLFVQL